MEVINDLSRTQDLTLSIIADTLDSVSTQMKGVHSVGQHILPTHTFADAPDLDVLIVPGGYGGFDTTPELKEYIRTTVPKLGHLITVCNGAAVVAQTGVLDGKSATTNKAYWSQCVAFGPKVNWVAKARWVHDGNVWTSSGVSAGIDVVLAWVESEFGSELATEVANSMEFQRAESPSDDPFTALYNCKDVPAQI
jgi:transcriptional regulator GlxA family with amidase domain